MSSFILGGVWSFCVYLGFPCKGPKWKFGRLRLVWFWDLPWRDYLSRYFWRCYREEQASGSRDYGARLGPLEIRFTYYPRAVRKAMSVKAPKRAFDGLGEYWPSKPTSRRLMKKLRLLPASRQEYLVAIRELGGTLPQEHLEVIAADSEDQAIAIASQMGVGSVFESRWHYRENPGSPSSRAVVTVKNVAWDLVGRWQVQVKDAPASCKPEIDVGG